MLMLPPYFTTAQARRTPGRVAPKGRETVCLLGAALSTGNMGVSTLAACAIKCILSRFPSADLFLLDYDRQPRTYRLRISGKEVEVPLVNIRFSKRIYLSNHIGVLLLLALLTRVIPWRTVKEYLISHNPCLHRIREADFTAAVSGGDSFSDLYGLGRFFYTSLPQLLVLLMGKELILLPQTLGPFETKIARRIASYILAQARLIYSRDYAGFKQVEALLGRARMLGKTRFCYDLGFVLDPAPPAGTDWAERLEKQKGKRCVVGLNVSGLLFAGGYTQDNMFGLRTDYKTLVYELIDLLVRKKQAVVLLVPHVFASAEYVDSDSAVCARLFRELKPKYGDQFFWVEGNYNQSEIKYIIGLCDFFMGSRMHACIGALSQSVPTIGLAYSEKFMGVMQSIGMESLVTDLRKMQKNEILEVAERAYKRRDSIRQELSQKIPDVKRAVLNLLGENDIGLYSLGAERVQ